MARISPMQKMDTKNKARGPYQMQSSPLACSSRMRQLLCLLSPQFPCRFTRSFFHLPTLVTLLLVWLSNSLYYIYLFLRGSIAKTCKTHETYMPLFGNRKKIMLTIITLTIAAILELLLGASHYCLTLPMYYFLSLQ